MDFFVDRLEIDFRITFDELVYKTSWMSTFDELVY